MQQDSRATCHRGTSDWPVPTGETDAAAGRERNATDAELRAVQLPIEKPWAVSMTLGHVQTRRCVPSLSSNICKKTPSWGQETVPSSPRETMARARAPRRSHRPEGRCTGLRLESTHSDPSAGAGEMWSSFFRARQLPVPPHPFSYQQMSERGGRRAQGTEPATKSKGVTMAARVLISDGGGGKGAVAAASSMARSGRRQLNPWLLLGRTRALVPRRFRHVADSQLQHRTRPISASARRLVPKEYNVRPDILSTAYGP
jgi:hypothetical protein